MMNQRSEVRGPVFATLRLGRQESGAARQQSIAIGSNRLLLNILPVLAAAMLFFLSPLPASAQEAKQRTSVVRLTPEVKKAITRGLEFLAESQLEDGSFGTGNKPGGTALALMSFMVQGHIPGEGKYGKTMAKAIDFLIACEKKKGYIHEGSSRGMYEHGLAVLALSEVWGQSQDPRIRETLMRAVNCTLNAQNSEGGWRYGPNPTGSADLSCAAMQMVALASARESGIAVPEKAMQRAVDYVVSCEVRATGGFAYQTLAGAPMGGAGYGRSAAGTLALMLCGARNHPAARGGAAFVYSHPDSVYESAGNFGYSHYYAAQAMYQAGDKYFNRYYSKISKALLKKQGKKGDWGGAVGTGFSILTLGVPYRFLPIYQK